MLLLRGYNVKFYQSRLRQLQGSPLNTFPSDTSILFRGPDYAITYDIFGAVLPLSAIIRLHCPSFEDKVVMHHPIAASSLAEQPRGSLVRNRHPDSNPRDMNYRLVTGIYPKICHRQSWIKSDHGGRETDVSSILKKKQPDNCMLLAARGQVRS